ncbi:hypothetical protein GGD66_006173 [Bradyrhizobium sp. CIR48]|uniref:VOC family protein n=1 Tax=Bradyrhizobium sp. CIR48 TaxID=2663840 RepID=UPI001605EE81|nr:VOC family protein [Bradyrhizobium sp. CIR48]MBB4427590.1 hypothetical protein [Bradyrhizobium sp. CIR48]
MTSFLGIDHPLIVVRDIDEAVRRYKSLGFTITPVTRHPWGTSTAVAMFEGCLLELMGVYDESLIDEKPVGDFRFGRVVRDHLAEREGISLCALHSEDAEGDAAIVVQRGISCQGTIEFGRDVVLPDGRKDRTRTTLKIFNDPRLPRLSNFACQQHRPDLIYVPAWLSHPNKSYGISQVTILAEAQDHDRVRRRLAGLYGEAALFQSDEGFGAKTGNGSFIVLDPKQAERRYGAIPAEILAQPGPCYIAIDIRVPSVEGVVPFVEAAGVPHLRTAESLLLSDAKYYGNVFLTFAVPSATGEA